MWEGEVSLVAASTNRVAVTVRARLIERLIFLFASYENGRTNFPHADYCDFGKLERRITRTWAKSEQRGHVLCKIAQTENCEADT